MPEPTASRLKDLLTLAEFVLKGAALILLVIVVWMFKDPLLERLSGGVKEVEAFGVRISFVENQLRATFSEAAASGAGRWQDANAALPSIRSRLEAIGRFISGARALWLDEGHPSSNLYERRTLQTLGVSVDMVQTPEEARTLLKIACYDVVISEMRRGDDNTAGLKFATELHETPHAPSLVFYILNLDRSRGTPAYAHGITNSPTELIHMVLDVLERRLESRCAALIGN